MRKLFSAISAIATTAALALAATPAQPAIGATCSGTNGTDVQIPDLSTVNSPITIAGCPGNAANNATVEVHIVHTTSVT
jgi:hypothetical protein